MKILDTWLFIQHYYQLARASSWNLICPIQLINLDKELKTFVLKDKILFIAQEYNRRIIYILNNF